MRPSSLSMRDVFPPSVRPTPKPQRNTDTPALSDNPPLDEKARKHQELEERYGLSMRVLELVKRYDVRSIHGDELETLGFILATDGNYSFQDTQNDEGSSDYHTFGYFKFDAGGGDALAFYQRRLNAFQQKIPPSDNSSSPRYDYVAAEQRNVEFLQRLADIHDALQEESDVITADENQLENMRLSLVLDEFAQSYRHEPERYDELSQAWIDKLGQAMQRRGISIGEAAPDKSSKEQLDSLWQSYQRWEEVHPPAARVDVWV